MKKTILLCCFYCFCHHLVAQITLYGRVTTRSGYPLSNVLVNQKTSGENFTTTNSDGTFTIYMVEEDSIVFYFKHPYFAPLTLSIEGHPELPLWIKLDALDPPVRDTSEIVFPTSRPVRSRKKRPIGWGLSGNLDFYNPNYNEFLPELGALNVEELNETGATFGAELIAIGRRIDIGWQFGFASNTNSENDAHDTLEIEVGTTLYGLRFSYRLLETKRLYFHPLASIRHYRTRLVNGYGDDVEVALPQFAIRDDLDLRINQTVGVFGGTLGWKWRGKETAENAYLSAGVRAGYTIRLRKNPKLWGPNSVVSTTKQIGLNNLTMQIFIAANFLK